MFFSGESTGPQASHDFDVIYEEHFQKIFNYILMRVANVAEAEDLTAQTFLNAWKSLWRMRWSGAGSVQAWLYRIATNEVNASFRKKKRQGCLPEEDALIDPFSHADRELQEAEQELAQNKVFLDLNKAIRTLKAEDQTLITLRYFEQKSFAEIARIVGRREGTLTMRTHRALRKLEKELKKRGIDHERIRGCFKESAQTGYPGATISAKLAPGTPLSPA